MNVKRWVCGWIAAGIAAVLVTGAGPALATSDTVQGVLDAGGQRQWISCSGTGSPTIVISAGLGDTHASWGKVTTPLRKLTRVCVYDRPGLGNSPTRQGSSRTDAGQHSRELRALLAKAGERGPFIIVAHSYAGLIARAFAAQSPNEVVGVMLVDAVYPGIHRTFLPSYHGPWHEGGTIISMAASERATAGGPNLGDTPLVVLTAGSSHVTSWADRTWNAQQDRAARLSTNSQHWYATHSSHTIQKDQPSIVLRGARWLLSQARGASSR